MQEKGRMLDTYEMKERQLYTTHVLVFFWVSESLARYCLSSDSLRTSVLLLARSDLTRERSMLRASSLNRRANRRRKEEEGLIRNQQHKKGGVTSRHEKRNTPSVQEGLNDGMQHFLDQKEANSKARHSKSHR